MVLKRLPGDRPRSLSDLDLIEVGREVLAVETASLQALQRRLDESFARAVRLMHACRGRVILAGVGKSGTVAQKIAGTLSSVGIPAFFIHPVEALHGDLGRVTPDDLAILISYSGETAEIIRLMEWLHRLGVPIVALTGRLDSTLARYSNVVLDVQVPREASPGGALPTSSTTATLAMGDALAVALMRLRGLTDEEFARYHPGGTLGRMFLRVDQFMHTGERLPRVRPETPFRDMVEEVTRKGFGCALVVDAAGRLVGIVTDGDIRRAIERHAEVHRLRARDVMTAEPKTLHPNHLVADALRMLETFRITVLPVVNADMEPVGLVHLHDLWRTQLI